MDFQRSPPSVLMRVHSSRYYVSGREDVGYGAGRVALPCIMNAERRETDILL